MLCYNYITDVNYYYDLMKNIHYIYTTQNILANVHKCLKFSHLFFYTIITGAFSVSIHIISMLCQLRDKERENLK